MAMSSPVIVGRGPESYLFNPFEIIVDVGWNERQDFDLDPLMASIDANGQREPIKVRKEGTTVHLVDGQRRLLAICQLMTNGSPIKGIYGVFEERTRATPAEWLLDSLVCNTGKPFTPVEEARVLARLLNFGWNQGEVARRIGKSESYVSQALDLLSAGPELVEALQAKEITKTEALAVVREARKEGTDQKALLDKAKRDITPAEKLEKALKVFRKSLDAIGLDEALLTFIAYARCEYLEFLIEPLTQALTQLEHHGMLAEREVAD